MDSTTIVVMFLGALIFFSHIFNRLFDRTKIPNVLLLLIIGIIVGTFINKELFFGEMGRVFTTITLVIILFESGIGLKFRELKVALGSSTLLTIFNFLFSIAGITAILVVFKGFDVISGIFLGAILGGTSSAVVIPMVRQLKLGTKSSTTLLLESAFSDVLCLIVGLAAIEGMKAGELHVDSMLTQMWKSFLYAALLGIVGGVCWSMLLNWMPTLRKSTFTTFAFLFIVYGGVELLGFNGGIAALCLGIILGNSESVTNTKVWKMFFRFEIAQLEDKEKEFFSEIVFVLQTYFFVYVGVVLEFGSISIYVLALLIVLYILAIRPIGVKFFTNKGCTPNEKTMMSVMSPKGLIPAILATIPLQLGLKHSQDIAELAYAVVLLSITICSILVMIISKNPLFFSQVANRMKKQELQTEGEVEDQNEINPEEIDNDQPIDVVEENSNVIANKNSDEIE